MVDTDVLRGRQFVLRRLDGYVCYSWEEDADVGLADAEEAIAAVERMAGSRRLPVLVDMRGMRTLDRDARSR